MWRKTNILIYIHDTLSDKLELLYTHNSWNPTRQSDYNQWPINLVFLLILLIDNFLNLYQQEDYHAKLTK
jgi:hypothetical protein